MHYTGMAAARFTSADVIPDLRHAVSISSLGIASITIVTFFVLGVALLTAVVDRRFSEQALRLESSEQRYRQLVESAQVILWRRDVQSSVFSFVNREAELTSGLSPGTMAHPAWLLDRAYLSRGPQLGRLFLQSSCCCQPAAKI